MSGDEDHDAMPAWLAAMLLRAARVHGKLSQRELAAKAGVSASTVARAEAGTGPPTPTHTFELRSRRGDIDDGDLW